MLAALQTTDVSLDERVTTLEENMDDGESKNSKNGVKKGYVVDGYFNSS